MEGAPGTCISALLAGIDSALLPRMRILISGAGIAGLTLALCLHRQGHEVMLVEKRTRLRGEDYMIDFFGPGCQAAERLGLLPRLQSIRHFVEHQSFLSRSGALRFTIPYTRLQAAASGRTFNFMRGELERVLSEELAAAVPIRFGTEVVRVQPSGDAVSVTLSDAKRYSYDLLVGADGVHSKVRALCFGNERSYLRYLGCHTATCIVDGPSALSGLDHTFFTIALPRRQAVAHPIRDGRVAVFFLHADASPEYENVQFAIRNKLEHLYGDLGWYFPELLLRQREASYVYYDSVSQIRMDSWTRGRVVLLGDAGWCVSLLSGQGASLAMAGAYALAEELGRTADVGAALSRYERRLRPLVERKQKEGLSFASWLMPRSAVKCAIRDMALRMMSWNPTLNRLRSRSAGDEAY